MRMIRKASNCFRTLIESAPSCPQRQRCLLTVFEDRLLRMSRGGPGKKEANCAGHRDAARSSTDIAPRQPSDFPCVLSASPPGDSAGVLFAHRTLRHPWVTRSSLAVLPAQGGEGGCPSFSWLHRPWGAAAFAARHPASSHSHRPSSLCTRRGPLALRPSTS